MNLQDDGSPAQFNITIVSTIHCGSAITVFVHIIFSEVFAFKLHSFVFLSV